MALMDSIGQMQFPPALSANPEIAKAAMYGGGGGGAPAPAQGQPGAAPQGAAPQGGGGIIGAISSMLGNGQNIGQIAQLLASLG